MPKVFAMHATVTFRTPSKGVRIAPPITVQTTALPAKARTTEEQTVVGGIPD